MARMGWIKVTELLVVLLMGTATRSQTLPSWSPGFGQAGLVGDVFSLGLWNGHLVAGGVGFTANGQLLSRLALLQQGSWTSVGGGIPGTSGSILCPLSVQAIIQYGSDLVVAGHFAVATSNGAASGIARWDGFQWHPLGQGLSLSSGGATHVRALAIFQGELYAGGDFDLAGGQPISFLARWDGLQWHAVGGGLGGPPLANLTTGVSALLAHGNKLYVGGAFTLAGALNVGSLAAWDGTNWSSVGGGVFGLVNAIEAFQGTIVVAGAFGSAGGGVSVNNIAAFDGLSWSPLGTGTANGLNGIVWALEVFANNLYAGGAFNAAGIAGWNGSQWFGIGSVSGGAPSRVLALIADGTRLYVGGDFNLAGLPGQMVASANLAAYDGGTWASVGGGLGFNDWVARFLPWNGGVVAVGRFTAAGNTSAVGAAFFDGQSWSAIGNFSQLNLPILDAVVFNNELVVAGGVLGSVWKFNGAQWQNIGNSFSIGMSLAVYQGQLYSGGVGSPRRWTGTSWQPFGLTLFGFMEVMQVHQGLLYIGGSTAVGGHLSAWDGTSMSSVSVGGGLNGAVRALTSFGQDLVVGGDFTQAGGMAANHVATWDGSSWQPLGTGVPQAVLSVAPLNGTLYVGGPFNQGPGFAPNRVARWTGNTFAPLGNGLNGPARALFGDDLRGQLWVGGSFTQAGGHFSDHVGIWLTLPVWADLGQALPGTFGPAQLAGFGSLTPGSPLNLQLSGALPGAPGFFVLSLVRLDLPLLGGTLVPSPDVLVPFIADSAGDAILTGVFPSNGPANLQGFVQCWFIDAGGPQGAAASNAVMRMN